MKIPRALIYLLAAIPTPTLAQSHLPQGIAEELEDWRAHYGPEWEIVYDETTSMARMLFGGKLPAPYVPQTEAEEFALGRFFLDKAYGLFGLDDDTLEDDRTIFLPLGMVAGTDKLAVRFRQVVDGVPLHEGWVNVLLDAGDGSLLSIDSMGQPNLRNFDVDPATDAPTAEALAEQEFEMQTGATADPIDPAALQVYEVGVGGLSTPELVWRVDVRGTDVAGVEHAFAYFVAAEGTPAIVAAVDRVSYFAPQVPGQGQTGKVRAKITANGTCSDLSCGHPCCFIPDGSAVPGRITVNLPHLTVENAAGQTTTTDANGEFVLAPPLPYTFRLEGPFVSVETRLSSQTLVAEASQLGTVVMNPTATEVNVAQTNAFQKINKMRDWVRHVNPLDATMDSSSAVASAPYLEALSE